MNRAKVILIGSAACLVAAISIFWSQPREHSPGSSLFPPEMLAAQHAERDVRADLGGVRVRIPKHFAEFVEMDNDPSWGQGVGESRPVRTPHSKLRSFGFYVRYPDMAGLSSAELVADKRSQTIYGTAWISVGITTGSYFPGSGFLDRLTARMNEPGRQFYYEPLTQQQHGLTVYSPIGKDPGTAIANRDHPDAEDIFIRRDSTGSVVTYINCSNRPHAAAPCTHTFTLEPDMRAKVYVNYRRGLLSEWQGIQASVSELIRGFADRSPSPAVPR